MCVLALLMANWSAEFVNYWLPTACECLELCAHTHTHALVRMYVCMWKAKWRVAGSKWCDFLRLIFIKFLIKCFWFLYCYKYLLYFIFCLCFVQLCFCSLEGGGKMCILVRVFGGTFAFNVTDGGEQLWLRRREQ